MQLNPHRNLNGRFRGATQQQGAAAVEYLLVTTIAVMALVITDATGAVALPELAQAIVNFYANFSYTISLATQ